MYTYMDNGNQIILKKESQAQDVYVVLSNLLSAIKQCSYARGMGDREKLNHYIAVLEDAERDAENILNEGSITYEDPY